MIIVTSDHGENLGDHGRMDHQFGVHETLLGRAFATVRRGEMRLTASSDGAFELHDLSPDPGERENILPLRPQIAQTMRKHLPPLITLPNHPSQNGHLLEADEEMAARLRALGYAE